METELSWDGIPDMNDLALVILLQALGVIAIIAEIVLPSAGLLTVGALVLFGFSLYRVFTEVSFQAGMIFVIIDVVTIPVLILIGIKMLARSNVSLRSSLAAGSMPITGERDYSVLKGHTGKAITDLRPSGKARIDGKRYDVVAKGDFIESDTDIEVVLVEGNRIVVGRTKSKG